MNQRNKPTLAQQRYFWSAYLFVGALLCALFAAGLSAADAAEAADMFRGGAMVAGLGGALMGLRWVLTTPGGER